MKPCVMSRIGHAKHIALFLGPWQKKDERYLVIAGEGKRADTLVRV